MQNKDLPFCIIFVNFTFASRKNKHLREQDAMSNELCITGWVQGPKGDRNEITSSYFSDDIVATSFLAGGNPGAWTLKGLWQVFSTNNSMHSCYGTGQMGCAQVQNPLPSGHQGTPDGNATLIQYRAGKRVDAKSNESLP